jgi:hypothetical protein
MRELKDITSIAYSYTSEFIDQLQGPREGTGSTLTSLKDDEALTQLEQYYITDGYAAFQSGVAGGDLHIQSTLKIKAFEILHEASFDFHKLLIDARGNTQYIIKIFIDDTGEQFLINPYKSLWEKLAVNEEVGMVGVEFALKLNNRIIKIEYLDQKLLDYSRKLDKTSGELVTNMVVEPADEPKLFFSFGELVQAAVVPVVAEPVAGEPVIATVVGEDGESGKQPIMATVVDKGEGEKKPVMATVVEKPEAKPGEKKPVMATVVEKPEAKPGEKKPVLARLVKHRLGEHDQTGHGSWSQTGLFDTFGDPNRTIEDKPKVEEPKPDPAAQEKVEVRYPNGVVFTSSRASIEKAWADIDVKEQQIQQVPAYVAQRGYIDGNVTPEMREAMHTAQSECWRRAGMREELFIIEPTGKLVKYDTGGKGDIVEPDFLGLGVNKLAMQSQGNVVIHSHPEDTAFSLQDYKTTILEGSCAEMQVVSKNYIFSLKPPAMDEDLQNPFIVNGHGRRGLEPKTELSVRWGEVRRAVPERRGWEKLKQEKYEAVKERIMKGELPQDANVNFHVFNAIWQEVADKSGATYTITPVNKETFKGAKPAKELWGKKNVVRATAVKHQPGTHDQSTHGNRFGGSGGERTQTHVGRARDPNQIIRASVKPRDEATQAAIDKQTEEQLKEPVKATVTKMPNAIPVLKDYNIEQAERSNDSVKKLLNEIEENFPEGERRNKADSAALSANLASTNVMTLRDSAGGLHGVAAYHRESDYVMLDDIGTSGKYKGAGTMMMRDVCKRIADLNQPLYLTSLESARSFYQQLGMHSTSTSMYFTAEEVRNFAATGNAALPAAKGEAKHLEGVHDQQSHGSRYSPTANGAALLHSRGNQVHGMEKEGMIGALATDVIKKLATGGEATFYRGETQKLVDKIKTDASNFDEREQNNEALMRIARNAIILHHMVGGTLLTSPGQVHSWIKENVLKAADSAYSGHYGSNAEEVFTAKIKENCESISPKAQLEVAVNALAYAAHIRDEQAETYLRDSWDLGRATAKNVIRATAVKHLPGEHDQATHGSWSQGKEVPEFDRSRWLTMDNSTRKAEWKKTPEAERDRIADPERSVFIREANLLKPLGVWKQADTVEDMVKQRVESSRDDIVDTARVKIQNSMSTYLDTLRSCGVSDADIEPLAKLAADHLLAMEMETQTQPLGDHGVHHLMGDTDRTLDILRVIPGNENPTPEQMAEVYLTGIFHDSGYLTEPGRIQLGGHAKWAQMHYDANVRPAVAKALGEEAAARISQNIKTHSTKDIDWENDAIGSAMRVSDNTSLFEQDKLPPMLREIPGNIDVLFEMQQGKLDLDSGKKAISENIKSSSLSPRVKGRMQETIELINKATPKTTLSMLGGTVDKVSWKDDHVAITLKEAPELSKWNTLLDVGQRQFAKFAEAYSLDGEKFKTDLNFQFKTPDGKVLLEGIMEKSKSMPIRAQLKHMPGDHDQTSHGNRDGTTGDKWADSHPKLESVKIEKAEISRQGMQKLKQETDHFLDDNKSERSTVRDSFFYAMDSDIKIPAREGTEKAFLALRDDAGKVHGLCHFYCRKNIAGPVYVSYMVSSGHVRGVGAPLMREACKMAAKYGKGISLTSSHYAEPFYTALGMTNQGEGYFTFTQEEAANFAATGNAKLEK